MKRSALLVVQPYTDRTDRLTSAIVVSEHATAAEAFAELDRMADRLRHFSLPGNAIEMLVVDTKRRPVLRGH